MCINFQPAANPAFLAERLGPLEPPVGQWPQDIYPGYNARSETAASKPNFRSAWAAGQWVLVPMECFFEPCWEDAPANGGRPDEEKRMPVIVPPEHYADWLSASPAQAMDLMRAAPASELAAVPAPLNPDTPAPAQTLPLF